MHLVTLLYKHIELTSRGPQSHKHSDWKKNDKTIQTKVRGLFTSKSLKNRCVSARLKIISSILKPRVTARGGSWEFKYEFLGHFYLITFSSSSNNKPSIVKVLGKLALELFCCCQDTQCAFCFLATFKALQKRSRCKGCSKRKAIFLWCLLKYFFGKILRQLWNYCRESNARMHRNKHSSVKFFISKWKIKNGSV